MKSERKRFWVNIRLTTFNLMNKVLREDNIPKSTFIQQAIIEKMMYSESFRKEILETLEQNRDIDYIR